MPGVDPSFFFGGPDAFDFFQGRNRFPNAQGSSALTGNASASVTFTCAATGTLVLAGNAECFVNFTCVASGTNSTVPTPIVTGRKRHGGAIPTFIRKPQPQRQLDDYEPKLQPVGLVDAYDAMLSDGAISFDEWYAIQALYGVEPVMA
jgi:hypothetical protein